MSELTKDPEKEEKISAEDYQSLVEKYQFSAQEIAPGKLVKGKVIKITPTHILVDIGFKSEGIIPVDEFEDKKEIETIQVGDHIETILERTNLKEGYLLLSKRKADVIKALDNLEKAYSHDGWISGTIIEKIKNGYTVDVGLKTFLPDSHADIRTVREPEKLIGMQYKFKVIKFDRKSENAVLSRKLFLQDERTKRKKRVFSTLAKGKKSRER